VAIIADWTTSDCTPNRAVTRARADCRAVRAVYRGGGRGRSSGEH
jgi:hypothetical protein